MNVLKIKATVRARDGFCCSQCGMSNEEHRATYGKSLEVHRVIPGSPYTLDGCVTLCRKCHGPMPKSKRGSLPFVSVTIDARLYRLIRTIAAWRRVSPGQYLESILRPALAVELRGIVTPQAPPHKD